MVVGFSLVSPGALINTAQYYVANAVVGMTVGVLPNPDSTLAMQLKAKEDELRAREQALAVKEHNGSASNTLTFALALFSVGMSLMLFALLAFNFFLDMKRRVIPVKGLSIDLRS